MQLGMIGLGRMGGNMVRRLMRAGHELVVTASSPATIATFTSEGATGAATTAELVAKLKAPRAVWIMVPADAVDGVVDQLLPHLAPGDCIIDGGNSAFEHDIRRARDLATRGIDYVDVGTSGGVWGLERGYCLMIGGPDAVVARLMPVFRDLAPGRGDTPVTPGMEKHPTASGGYLHCGPAGAGHFVKMVHNGIEYGLMAAYAEGFNLFRHAGAGKAGGIDNAERYQYDFDLPAIAELWRRGSVVSSWLLDLTAKSLAEDPRLDGFQGKVSDSGEGRWTLKAAIDTAVPVPVLSAALYSRFESRGEADFANKVLSAMRFQFGGHQEPSK
jgi:6-phosphogluconate dehydrogenase